MLYNRDYGRISWMLLPEILRKPLLGALAEVMAQEIQVVHSRLVSNVSDMSYRLSHNSQKCYLQAACNDALDTVERRIRIYGTDVSQEVAPLMYDALYEIPILLSDAVYNNPVIVHDAQYYNAGGCGFQVVVPWELTDSERYRLIGVLEYYKLPSKNYIITKIQIL